MRRTTLYGAIAAGAVLAGTAALRRPGPKAAGAKRLPVMSLADTLAVLTEVLAPNIAKGVIKRRKRVVGVAERAELDTRAIRRVKQLRDTYGPGPVLLRVPVRNQAVILDPADAWRVLDETPAIFTTASSEKVAALRHFEPHGALISTGPERTERRRFNEAVLEMDCPVHSLADSFERVAREEADTLLAAAGADGEFGWDDFAPAWFRVVRRVVFGDGARDDEELREMVDSLREDGNWAMFKPRDKALREAFFARLRHHLSRAEPGSLAARVAAEPKNARTAPEHQIPQWLFAFDPAGMATYRAMGLLAAYPEQLARARAEATAEPGDRGLPQLRAAILEALRLWPTTPLILRQSLAETRWATGVLPKGAGVLIYAPFFHRDDTQLAFAHRFAPEIWAQDPPAHGWPLVPFSGGPAVCPGRHVVLMVGAMFLRRLLAGHGLALGDPARLPPEALPGTYDHYTMRYRLVPA